MSAHADGVTKQIETVFGFVNRSKRKVGPKQKPVFAIDSLFCEEFGLDLIITHSPFFLRRFTLELSQRMTYAQWAVEVGQRMNVDPYEIQFFKCQK